MGRQWAMDDIPRQCHQCQVQDQLLPGDENNLLHRLDVYTWKVNAIAHTFVSQEFSAYDLCYDSSYDGDRWVTDWVLSASWCKQYVTQYKQQGHLVGQAYSEIMNKTVCKI